MNEKNKRDEAVAQDINSMFDAIISKSELTDTFELIPGLNITLKTLNTGEILSAEADAVTNNIKLPLDVMGRGRIISLLTAATQSINGVDIIQDNLSDADNYVRKISLHNKYLKLPPELVDIAYGKYNKLQSDKVELLNKPIEEISNGIKTF